MALNADRVGTVYPAFVYEVSREKIREYAAAVGESDPRYFADDDEMVAPPTFAACFSIGNALRTVLDDPQLGAHPRLVHGSQSFTYGDRPMRPGDVLRCEPSIVSITPRGDNEFLVIALEATFVSDETLAARAESTIVFLGSANGSDAG
ncbi:MAG: MaoC family dehydratase N-terminal domain-containing protein [Nitriliruptoraceae bacterium]